jgi:hypoxia-inducible factor 1 alpha
VIPDPPLYQTPVSGSINSGGRAPPQTATASIFAPRTKDMNKGFLTFSEDQPGLTSKIEPKKPPKPKAPTLTAYFSVLKDEPEDLTHLAPTAGDVCVSLEDPPFLTDMLDEFILNANYCPLLSPELPTGAPELTEPGCGGPAPAATPCQLKDAERTILDEPHRRDEFCSAEGADPFIYRDSPSRCSLGTELHSPTLTKVRPLASHNGRRAA